MTMLDVRGVTKRFGSLVAVDDVSMRVASGELRAIIGTDGTVQSLEAVGGDPMFYQSAMDAVRQWRYTPTLLNGRRVEVDTYITVVYTMQR